MNSKPDLLVYSPTDELQLVVEVKNKRGASDQWASRLRRNLVAHSIIPKAKFFLLALPEHLWLWRDTQSLEDVPPDFKVATRDVLRPYLRHWPKDFPSENTFELLVKSWLSDLTHSHLSKESVPSELRWLFDSGLYDSIRLGNVERETFA
jgi:hypothetical protein